MSSSPTWAASTYIWHWSVCRRPCLWGQHVVNLLGSIVFLLFFPFGTMAHFLLLLFYPYLLFLILLFLFYWCRLNLFKSELLKKGFHTSFSSRFGPNWKVRKVGTIRGRCESTLTLIVIACSFAKSCNMCADDHQLKCNLESLSSQWFNTLFLFAFPRSYLSYKRLLRYMYTSWANSIHDQYTKFECFCIFYV